MKSGFLLLAATMSACSLLTACFSPLDDNQPSAKDGMRQLTINVISFNQQSFSRASGAESVTHLDIAIFNAADQKVLKVNQKSGDEDFLHPTISVPKDELKFVIMAHGGEGSATISSQTEVKFPNNKVTDTFAYYDEITVSDESPSEMNVTLERSVAMVRLIMTDTELPEACTKLELFYTGGSSTYNPKTGFGSVNSRQTEIRTIADATVNDEGYRIFEIYTFPHVVDDELKLKITPLNSNGNAVATERVIDGIPIRLNSITECQGNIFGAGLTGSAMTITINDVWEDTFHIDF